jgi:2-aminoadipate transaminase
MNAGSLSTPSPPFPLARWCDQARPSGLQELSGVSHRADVLSFALGLPAPELFPAEALARAAQTTTARGTALQYGEPDQALVSHVVELMRRRGVTCEPRQIFLTSGAQQGLNLLCRVLCQDGARIAVEQITYPGFLQALAPYQLRLTCIRSTVEHGIDLEQLERALSTERPAALFVMSDGHNPLGVSLSVAARRAIVELSARTGVPIIEDDTYGLVQHEPMLPPLRALDAERVLYVGSFSKLIAPALRVGWLVVPEAMIRPLSIAKESTDLDVGTLTQAITAGLLASWPLEPHLAELLRVYGARRAAMRSALKRHFPAGSRFSDGRSGFFVWVELPAPLEALELLQPAIEREGVAFVPGIAFASEPCKQARRGLRLSFSRLDPDQIEEGIRRLGQLCREALVRA